MTSSLELSLHHCPATRVRVRLRRRLPKSYLRSEEAGPRSKRRKEVLRQKNLVFFEGNRQTYKVRLNYDGAAGQRRVYPKIRGHAAQRGDPESLTAGICTTGSRTPLIRESSEIASDSDTEIILMSCTVYVVTYTMSVV